jgi:hypothetical protein
VTVLRERPVPWGFIDERVLELPTEPKMSDKKKGKRR